MRKRIFLLLPLLLTANCDTPAAQTAEANPDKYFEPQTSDIVGATGDGNSALKEAKPGDPLSPFNADGSIKPSFDTATLLRLNAIMRKYDAIRPGIEKLVADAAAAPGDTAKAAKAREGLGQIRVLQAEAIAARKELAAEGQQLVDSKQYYDQVVFSGMATFATRVEDEFADDLKAMSAKLKS
jgi:hypothetical protein